MKACGLGWKFWSLIGVLLLAGVGAGCSGGKIVTTYEGSALAKPDVAVLTAPDNIALISVNGKVVPKYLLSSIEVNYGLKPGANLVVFEYASVWSNANQMDKDDARAEEVKSAPKEVLINAAAGNQFTFSFVRPTNIREAKVLAANFSADIIDASNQVVARSEELGSHQAKQAESSSQLVENAALPASADIAATDGSSLAPTTGLPTIDALKALWRKASAAEQKEFLKWAFQ